EETYEGTGKLRGRNAIITGADSGIGRAVALAFAREGANVLISYLSEDADAKETARVVEEAGVKAVLVPGDIAEDSHCRHIIDKAMEEFGSIDLLVNNAAYQMGYENGLVDIPSDEIEYVFRVNIIAQFRLSKYALVHMKAGAGIINTASVQAYQPSPELLHYAATKAAIVNFTQGLAQQVIEQGIRVNCVAPGPVWTPLIPMSFPGDKVKDFGAQAPIGRPAQPAELAPAYVFLASPESNYLVGEVIGVTGGMPVP
ncbi:MAG: SDR family oxidoreductase, partial [Actinobacteria bacterium]|nr:SDR family oxidoreductase [Actinomycetota bacterium]